MRTLSPRRRRRAPRIPTSPTDAGGPFRSTLSDYRQTTAAEGSAPETLRTQTQCIARFIQWAEAAGIGDCTEVSPRTVEAYQRHLNQYRKRDGQPLSIGAQLVSLAALKAWFKWMVRERDLPSNPAGWIRLPRLPANLPAAILGLPTIEALLSLADTGSPTGLRDRALFELLYATGVRRMELAYSAYGETAVLGPDGGNALRYTGREDDGSGLFYYRARYYDPVLKRFVSEDPIGLEAGPSQMVMRNAGIQNPAPMSCMEKCMASKLGLMAVTSAGRQAGFTLAQRYGGAAVTTVVGIAGSTWTSAAAMLALPYLGFLADQCQQQCGLQCGGPPSTLFFNAP